MITRETIGRIASSLVMSWTDKIDDRPRPARMKKPKVTPAAHRKYTEYVQDLFHNILVDKYGTKRGTENFEYFIGQNNRAMYTVGQDIQDEKAQMYLDLGEPLPRDYWHETYFDVWNRWMARPVIASVVDSMAKKLDELKGKAVEVEDGRLFIHGVLKEKNGTYYVRDKGGNGPNTLFGDEHVKSIDGNQILLYKARETRKQSNVVYQTFNEIRAKANEQGEHHHLRLTCVKCGTVNTCRCSAPKVDKQGICYDCSEAGM